LRDSATLRGTTGGAVGNFLGDVALMAPAGGVGGLARTGGQRLLANSGVGAAYAGAQPVVEGGSRAANAAIGGLAGAGGELASRGLGALAKGAGNIVSPQVRALYEAAKAQGITLTPAQLSDSKLLKYLGDRMAMYPLSGGASTQARQLGAWNESLAGTLGEKAKALTPDVFAAAKARIGNTFEELTARNSLPLGPQVMEGLRSVANDAASYAGDDTVKAVGNILRRVTDQSKSGALPGRTYQSIDSDIGRLAKVGGEKGMYLGQLRDKLREAMDEGIAGADKAAWQQARRQWRALKTVEPLVAKSDDGVLSPAALMGRVTANNAGKSSMAAGKAGELGALARTGQRIKPPPSSGTSERLLADSLFNPLNWPALGARSLLGGTVGRIPNSGLLSELLLGPAPGKALSAMSRAAPASGLAASPLLTDEERPLVIDIVGGRRERKVR